MSTKSRTARRRAHTRRQGSFAPATTPPNRIPELPIAGTRALVLGLFLFSGISGLIYEVVWSRMFVLVLGSTVYAVSTVLGVFMAGLALGSWLFGRWADRPNANGLRMYAWLELGIGAFAIVLPWLMTISDGIYRAVWPSLATSPTGQIAVRLLLATMILIIPSTLMGGTLPVLSRFLIRTRNRTATEIGGLYAINTLGAVLGCLIAGFLMLEYLGMRASLLTAACLNAAVGFLALYWSRRRETGDATAQLEPTPLNVRHYTPSQIRLALILYAFSGMAALSLEVLWTRSLLYFTSVDTYAFAAMLAAFLCGIGLGSLLMAPFAGRIREPLLVLGIIEVLIGVSAAASIPLLSKLYGAFTSVSEALPTATLTTKLITKLFASFFVMLVPTLLMGAAFPLVSAIYVGAKKQVGRGVGTLYALNTIGAIAGSLLAGFVLIPLFGLQESILLSASIYVALGLIMCATVPQAATRRIPAFMAVTAAIFALIFGNTLYEGRPMVLQSWFFKEPGKQHRLVDCHETTAASLSVLENPGGTRLLNINGVTTAINNYLDMQVHRMLSHLPILLHPDPDTVLVVGFGMGSTPWGCCQHDVDHVDVVELLPSEKSTARHFADINHNVLEHPRLRFIEGDGRNYLLATPQRYDVISFNAIHPRFSAYLYTKDFYELCEKRMSENGVICAWMTQNSMTETEFRMLCRSFVDVFPHSTLWYCNPEHFCLIGTMQPTRIDVADWQRRMAVDVVQRDLADSNLADPFVLISRFMLGGEALAKYVDGAPLNTDDHPRIEFARETKLEERTIIARLIGLTESVDPLLAAKSHNTETRAEVAVYQESALHVMHGQMDHWYPEGLHPLRPEIAYRKALLACPANQDARHNLVFSEPIKQDVQSRLRTDPNNIGALTRAGSIMMEEGQFRQAELYFTRALQLHSRFGPAAERLGLLHLVNGRVADSIPFLEGAYRGRKEPDPRFQYALAMALESKGETDRAAPLRAAAIATDADVAEWYDLFSRTVSTMSKQHAATAMQR